MPVKPVGLPEAVFAALERVKVSMNEFEFLVLRLLVSECLAKFGGAWSIQ
jgi:hypothetical protein